MLSYEHILLVCIFLVIIYYYKNNLEHFNHGERYYAPRETLNGCDIYGCTSQGKLNLKTYAPDTQVASQAYFIGDNACVIGKETNLNNYYPDKNASDILNLNGTNILVNTGLAVLKSSIKDAINVANNDVNLLENDIKYRVSIFNALGKTPIYLHEKPINISPFARYLVGIINKIGDGFHIYEYKFIDSNTIRKTVVDDQIRLEFDMVGRYKYSENNNYKILFNNANKIIDSLKDLIIRVELIMTKIKSTKWTGGSLTSVGIKSTTPDVIKKGFNSAPYIFVNDMYLIGYHNIEPRDK